ncbi:MAG: InlB B-repeat-containing protein [Clostridiales Family XIII bacterium]|nr:InlB B-repeat-containing protein [Clostridiales Family XIII bacterium]
MDGADVYLTQTVQRGGLAQEPGSPYHPDLAFAGWYTAPGPAAGEGAGEAYDFATPRGEPLVLYAAYGARAAESGDAAVPLPPGDGAGGEGGAGGTGGLGQAAASGGEGAEAAALEADAAPAYYDWTVLVDTKLDGAPADCEEVRLVPVGADGPAAGKVLGKDGTGAYKDTIRTASAEGGEEKYEVWVDGEPSGKTVRYAEGPDNYAEVSRWTVRVRTLAGGEPASAPGAGTLRAYGQGELDELALRQVSVGVYEKVYFEKKTLPFLADITYRVYFDGKDTGLDVAFSEEGREASLELELPAAPDDRVRSGAAPGGQGAEDAAGGARDARDAGGTAGENAGGGEDAGGTAGEGAGDAGESGTGAADAPRKATVTFETGGHGAYTPSERIVAVGKPLAADARSLDPGADEAYDFGGWYQDAACTQGYLWDVEEDPVRGDMTLYAKWTIKRHEVLFDMGAAGPGEGGAAAAETQTVNHGGLAARPQADPTAAGLVFTGWYKDGACTAPWDFSADTVTDATTIYAGWAEDADALPAEDPAPDAEAPAVTLNAGWPGALFAVRFEMNGHGAQIEPIYAYAGEALDAPVPVPHETGWTFGGWYTDKACSAESRWTFGDGGFRMPSGDLTLYAKWAVNTWGVDYLPNGHGGGSIFDVLEDVPFGTRLREPIKDPADDEYLFLGWYKDPSCAPGTEWVFADDTTPDRDLKLYAGWRAKDAVEVKYDLNGQEGRVPSTWLVPGQTIPAPAAPSAPGYAFGGWFKDKSCSDSKVWNFESEKVPEGGVTLYAKWVSMEVPLEAPAEGATEASAEGLAEAPVEAPEAEGQAEAPVAAPEAEAMAAARVQMQTALLLPEPVPRVASSMPEAYTVHYDGNGHGEAPADKTALSGLPMPAAPSPDPTEEGWVFTGWYKDQTCTVPWDFKNDVTPELPGTGKVVVCFAGWAPEGSGFVRFNLNGHGEGDAPATQAVPAGGWAEEPVPAPHEDGWTFTGWHTGWRTDVAAAWDFSANTMSDPARTITLYAGWELNRYKVYYDLQGRGVGTEPINPTITFGEAVARPAGDPVAAGWVFMGWYQDPSCSDGAEWVFKDGTYGAGGTGGVPGTMPAHDLRLYAKWRSTSAHAVTFVAGGAAETPPEQYLSVGDWVSEPVPAPVATAEGYTFSGWYRSETFEEASQWNFLVNRMPDADLTLYALFQSASGEPLQSGAPNGEAQASLALPVSFGWEDVPRYSGAGDVLQKGSSAAAGPEPLEIPGFPELQAFPVLQAFPELQAFPGPGLSDISARR